MTIDLHDPVSVGRSATEAVQRRAVDAVELARSVDLPSPTDAVAHAHRRARRAARRLERRVDRASNQATKRVHDESRKVARATAPHRSGRRTLVLFVVLVGGAAIVALLAKRMQQVHAPEVVPDPFGTAVRAGDHARDDGHPVTTG